MEADMAVLEKGRQQHSTWLHWMGGFLWQTQKQRSISYLLNKTRRKIKMSSRLYFKLLSQHSQFLAQELRCLHGLTLSECTMRKMTWLVITWSPSVERDQFLQWAPSLSARLESTNDCHPPSVVLLQGPLLILSTYNWPMLLTQFPRPSCWGSDAKHTDTINPRAAFPSYLPGWYPNRTWNKWNMGSSFRSSTSSKTREWFHCFVFFFPVLFFACVVFIGFLLFCNVSSKLKQEGHKRRQYRRNLLRDVRWSMQKRSERTCVEIAQICRKWTKNEWTTQNQPENTWIYNDKSSSTKQKIQNSKKKSGKMKQEVQNWKIQTSNHSTPCAIPLHRWKNISKHENH